MKGDVDAAVAYHERHLELSRQLQNQQGVAWAYGNLAALFESTGDYRKVCMHAMNHSIE